MDERLQQHDLESEEVEIGIMSEPDMAKMKKSVTKALLLSQGANNEVAVSKSVKKSGVRRAISDSKHPKSKAVIEEEMDAEIDTTDRPVITYGAKRKAPDGVPEPNKVPRITMSSLALTSSLARKLSRRMELTRPGPRFPPSSNVQSPKVLGSSQPLGQSTGTEDMLSQSGSAAI